MADEKRALGTVAYNKDEMMLKVERVMRMKLMMMKSFKR